MGTVGRWLVAAAVAAALAGCGGSGAGGDSGGGGGGSAPPDPPGGQPVDVSIARASAMAGDDAMAHVTFAVAAVGGDARDVEWSVRRRRDDALLGAGVIPAIPAGTESGELMVMDHAAVDGDTYVVAVATRPDDPVPANDSTEVMVVVSPSDPPPDEGRSPVGPGQVDLVFNDVHWHGMYYWRDLLFHFYVAARNPNGYVISHGRFDIEMDGALIYQGSVPTLQPPSAQTPYPRVEIKVTDAMIFGSGNPLAPARPLPGRHDFRVRLRIDASAPYTDADPRDDAFSLPIIAPTPRVWPGTPGALPDLRLSDPHVHHYPTPKTLRMHFQATNYHDATTIPNTRWRITREDGAVMGEGVFGPIAPRGIKEYAVDWTYEPVGEVEYRLRYDVDDAVPEADETNNEAVFIVDTTPSAPG